MEFFIIVIVAVVIFLFKKSATKDSLVYHKPYSYDSNKADKADKADKANKADDKTSLDEPLKAKVYKKISHLMTPAERSFYGVLKNNISDEFLIFSKVRLADVLIPEVSRNRSEWQKAFNRISSKHFDFVICTADDLAVVCVIELNDKSHQQKLRQQRDDFVREVCKSAKLKLIEIPAKNGYVFSEIKELLAPIIEDNANKEQTQYCAKCGAKMVVRTANKGERTGQPFWACSSYPKCYYIENITV